MIWPSKVGMVGLSIKKNRKSISSQKNSKKGFTLVELIVVLVILAIMAAAVIPALLGYTDHAKDKKYIETAKECLKASQTVLSDTFNNSSNTISWEKRYSAADMANVYIKNYNDDPSDPKKVGTRFYVWTAKRLEATGYKSTKPDGTQSVSSGTKATTDNMGAYTIVYAAFDTGNDKYVVYDGKDWTVKEKEDIDSFNLESSANVPEKYSKNIIHMWDYVDTDACDPKGYDVAGEDWTGKEGVSLSRKVILHFVNTKEDHGVVLASSEGGETISRDYSTFTLELNFTKEDSVIKCNECKNLRDGSEISVGGSKEYLKVEEDFSDLRWSTDPATVGDRQWTEDLDDLLSQIEFPQDEESEEMEPMDIYAWTTKGIERRNVNFVVTSSGNLKPAGSTQTIEFRRYANKYDKARNDGGYSLIRDEYGATEGPVSDPTGQNGYEFAGWAHNVSDDYERDADDKLVAYSDVETIWKAVFNTPEGQTPKFTAIGELNKTIIFKTDLHSGFGGLTQKELTVPIYKNDLTGEENDSKSVYDSAELKFDFGYRFKNWVEEESGEEFGLDYSPIKDYVIAGSKDSYTFNIVTEHINRAKIIGGAYNGTGNFPSAIRSLDNSILGEISVTKFVRDSYADGVSALGGENGIFGEITKKNPEDGRIMGNISASGSNIYRLSSGNHIAVYSVLGSLYRVAVLWDGDDDTFQAPIFAYSKSNLLGATEIHWFCYDDVNPEVYGDLSSTFKGFTNCNFSASDIENWNMANCDNLTSVFENCGSLKTGDINFSNWNDLSRVTSMAYMFKDCDNMAFTSVDFTGADLSSLTTMANWVDDCANLQTICLDRVNSPNLTNITNLTTNYTKNSSRLVGFYARGWKAGSVIGFGNMFKEKYNLQTVDFSGTAGDMTDLSGLTNMTNLFCFPNPKGRASDISLERVSFKYTDLSHVTEAKFMFVDRGNDTVEEPLKYVSFEGADLSSLRNIEGIFFHLFSVETINLDTSTTFAPSTCLRMFDSCTSLSSVPGLEKMNTSSVTTMENMFYRCNSMTSFDFTKFDYSHVQNMDRMFAGAGFTEISFRNKEMPNLTKVRSSEKVTMFHVRDNYGITEHCAVQTVDFSGCKMNNAGLKDLSYLFRDCTELENVYFNGFEVKNVTSIYNIFDNCTSLSIFQGIGWDLSGTTDLSNIFSNNTSLSTVDLTDANFSKVTKNYNLFNGCSGLETVTLDGCNMSGITGGINTAFFSGCYALDTVSANGWNINNCTSLSNLFDGKTSLTTVSMTDMKIDHVKHNNGNAGFNSMFKGCTSLTTVTMNVTTTNMSPNQQALNYMFDGCTSLTSVQFEDIDFNKIERFQCIFNGCTSYTKKSLENTISNWDYTQNTHLFSEENHKGNVGWNSLFNVGNCHESLRTGNKQEIIIRQGDKTFRWEIDGTYPKVKPNENPGHETRLNYYRDNEY